MENAGHAPLSETAARRVGSARARRGRPRKDCAHGNGAQEPKRAPENAAQKPNSADENVAQEATSDNVAQETAAAEISTPARGLLHAALRVWELKQRISE